MTAAKPPALVVGTGFGVRIHAPALQAAGFELAGLVGTDPERTARRAAAAETQPFTDLDEAIARTGAVAVSIATPPHTHGPLALAAIARGCHVLCEKPFASDLSEARAMLAAAERAGVTHLLGHEFRWQPDRALVGRAIAEGMIGEPRLLSLVHYISFLADPAAKMPRWWFDQAAGGGWLGAQGSHLIDQVRMWLGEFESVSATLSLVSAREAGSAEDTYALRFRLTNGVEGVIQQTAGAWGPSAAVSRVAGTTGTVWSDEGVVRVADRDGVRELPVPADLELPAPPTESDDPRKRFSHMELGPFIRLCEALKAGVDGREPKAAVPLPTFRDGVAEMAVLDAIRVSAAAAGALTRVEAV
jgi:predicted dehydrogenase